MFCIFIILFVHDFGHIVVLKKLGYKINKIEVFPFGANIETDLCFNSKSVHIFLISVAGVVFQMFLYVVLILLFELNFINFNLYNIFLKYNIILILFNLLPIYPLDGNKVLISLLECLFNFKLSLKISNLISFISVIILIYLNYLLNLDNFSIVLFLFFKVVSYIKEQKQVFNKFLVERIIFNYKYKRIKNVSSINKIYKNKLNFINGVSEKKIILKK